MKTNGLKSMYYVDSNLNIHHVYVGNSWGAETTKEGYKLFWTITKAYQYIQWMNYQTGKVKGKYIEDKDVIR